MNSNQLGQLIQLVLRSSRGKSSRWVWGVVVVIVAYALLQPLANRHWGWSLPGFENGGKPSSQSNDILPNVSVSPDGSETALKEIGPELFQSPAGLIYGPGSRHGHRLRHVMHHAHDDPQRAGPHGVFDSNDPGDVIRLIDDAYRLAQDKSKSETKQEQNRTVHTVNMNRRIGYVGGQSGARSNHPAATHLRLVLEKVHVITAFPVRP